MKCTMEHYRKIKSELQKAERKEKITYFNLETLEIILNDRDMAAETFANGGDVQEFYSGSKTLQTDFYKMNGSAYCLLLEILQEMRNHYSVTLSSENIGGTVTLDIWADNEKQAGIFAVSPPSTRAVWWRAPMSGTMEVCVSPHASPFPPWATEMWRTTRPNALTPFPSPRLRRREAELRCSENVTAKQRSSSA